MWEIFWSLIGVAILCVVFIGVFALGVAVYNEYKKDNIRF